MKHEFNINLLDILACPMCKSDLLFNDNKLFCQNINCKEEYIIEDGIPILLPKNIEKEQIIAIQTWNNDYLIMNQENKFDVIDKYALADYELIDSRINNEQTMFLEIGCGRARASLLVAKNHGIQVIGLDICIEALKYAKTIFQKSDLKGEFICGDILWPPFKNNSFDLIFGGGSVEHFKETQVAMNAISCILRKNGQLIVTIPVISFSTLLQGLITGNIPDIMILNNILYFWHYKILKGSRLVYGYEKSFTCRKILNILKTAGFNDVDIGRYDVDYNLKYFTNPYVKSVLRWLIKFKLWWPMIYVKCSKDV